MKSKKNKINNKEMQDCLKKFWLKFINITKESLCT
jgi:hypothetical protein